MRYQEYRESQPHHNVQFALQLLVIAWGGGGGAFTFKLLQLVTTSSWFWYTEF